MLPDTCKQGKQNLRNLLRCRMFDAKRSVRYNSAGFLQEIVGNDAEYGQYHVQNAHARANDAPAARVGEAAGNGDVWRAVGVLKRVKKSF